VDRAVQVPLGGPLQHRHEALHAAAGSAGCEFPDQHRTPGHRGITLDVFRVRLEVLRVDVDAEDCRRCGLARASDHSDSPRSESRGRGGWDRAASQRPQSLQCLFRYSGHSYRLMASSLVCSQFPIHNVCGGKLLTQLGQYPLRVRQLTLPPHVRTCVGQDRRLVCGQRQKLPGNKFLLSCMEFSMFPLGCFCPGLMMCSFREA
jgi:hypothetical protein